MPIADDAADDTASVDASTEADEVDASTEADEVDASTEADEVDHPALTCSGLVKRFGDRLAVDDVGFSIAAGESYGLLGPNGAGKTTTISILCGLLEPDAGEVTIAGRGIGEDPAVKSSIGYVPQEVALYPELSARENLRFFGRLYGMPRETLNKRIDSVLETAGLSERGRDRIDTYSGGMKRRLNIAAGLLHEPSLLVLDEPTVGVDPQSRHAIIEHVAALRHDGLAVLYTSHYMDEVEKLCDRVGIIDEGRLVAQGTTAELVESLGETDRVTLVTDGDAAPLVAALDRREDIGTVTPTASGLQVLTTDGAGRLPMLLATAADAGVVVVSVDVVRPNLESVFLHLTGKALRD